MFKFAKNTNKNGLKGVFTQTRGERHYIQAVDNTGAIVCEENWSIYGNHYRQGKKRFGDKLERAGYPRMGY